jgi:hypothetical protein
MNQHEQSRGARLGRKCRTSGLAKPLRWLKRRLTGEPGRDRGSHEPAAPYRIGASGSARHVQGRGAPPRITTDAELTTALGDFVNTLAKADLFSGTVFARQGRPAALRDGVRRGEQGFRCA